MIKFLLAILPVSIYTAEPLPEPVPQVFYWRYHQFLKFSDQCILHSPDCECNDGWMMTEGPHGWYIDRMPFNTFLD